MIDIEGAIRELLSMAARPTPSLYEGWQDESGIDLTRWGITLTGTGTVTKSAAEVPYLKVILAGATNNDAARLYGLQRWFCNADTGLAGYLKNSILQKLHMEFEAKIINVDKVLNTDFFMGLARIQTAVEATADIVGLILDASDNLRFLSSDGLGSTSVGAVVDAADVDTWHKFEIITSPGQVQLLLNGGNAGIINANLPEAALYPVFYLPQENAAGAPALHVAINRIWAEDILR
jgi:hypothetical protein